MQPMFCITLTIGFLTARHTSRFVMISSSYLYLFQNNFHIIKIIRWYKVWSIILCKFKSILRTISLSSKIRRPYIKIVHCVIHWSKIKIICTWETWPELQWATKVSRHLVVKFNFGASWSHSPPPPPTSPQNNVDFANSSTAQTTAPLQHWIGGRGYQRINARCK